MLRSIPRSRTSSTRSITPEAQRRRRPRQTHTSSVLVRAARTLRAARFRFRMSSVKDANTLLRLIRGATARSRPAMPQTDPRRSTVPRRRLAEAPYPAASDWAAIACLARR
jgi:hypothetical protein